MQAPQTWFAVVVDDSPMILMHATEILEEAGFSTLTAGSAEEALELLERQGEMIVLLFTDVDLPGRMNGFTLARSTADRWPTIGILVASGARTPKVGDLPRGAIFVAKPFSAEIIYDRVHQILPDELKPQPLIAKSLGE